MASPKSAAEFPVDSAAKHVHPLTMFLSYCFSINKEKAALFGEM